MEYELPEELRMLKETVRRFVDRELIPIELDSLDGPKLKPDIQASLEEKAKALGLWQFDVPEKGEGVVQAFRRAESVYEAARFKLRGLDPAWSPPGVHRTAEYAWLPPGAYSFQLRAKNSDGVWTPTPLSFDFEILPPFWRTWWFTGLVLILAAAVAYAFHRVSLRREVELERVRTRIATDLHDDIGSSLSQVSILTEVVRQQVHGDDPREAEPVLEQIAETARELVDSMSDIVWAVNPKRDRAVDLVQRMRELAHTQLALAVQQHEHAQAGPVTQRLVERLGVHEGRAR